MHARTTYRQNDCRDIAAHMKKKHMPTAFGHHPFSIHYFSPMLRARSHLKCVVRRAARPSSSVDIKPPLSPFSWDVIRTNKYDENDRQRGRETVSFLPSCPPQTTTPKLHLQLLDFKFRLSFFSFLCARPHFRGISRSPVQVCKFEPNFTNKRGHDSCSLLALM